MTGIDHHTLMMRAVREAMKHADALVEAGHNSPRHLAAMKRWQRAMYDGWTTNNRGACLRAMGALIDTYHGYLPTED